MDNFKLKLNVGDASIELEGNGDLVHCIFNELRENGLGKLAHGVKYVEKEEKVIDKDTTSIPNDNSISDKSVELKKSIADTELPNLNDFVIKGNPSTEAEWLLVYVLYQSERGSKLFTKEEIRQKYRETNRYTDTRNKNFAVNYKSLISSNFISSVNDTDYKITPLGKDTAEAIVLAEGEDKKKTKRQAKSFTSDTYKIVELNLLEDERKDFRNYYSGFKTLTNMEKAIVISNWLKEKKQMEEIDKDILFTMLKIANVNTSFDIKAALVNAKSNNKYFVSGTEKGKYKLHHIGEDAVRQLLDTKE